MYKDLISIGAFTVHSYGLMIATGVLAAYLFIMYRAKTLKIDIRKIDPIILWILFGGLFGAKFLYWITQIESILQTPEILLDISNGYVVYGGIIGGVFAGLVYCKAKRLSFPFYADLIIPSVALAQGFGRIGCFLAGCCYGMETTSGLGVEFPVSSIAPTGVHLLPTQLFSSILDFMLFVVLVFYAKRKKAEGQVTALYLVLYSVGRFALEFFRGDIERGSIGVLSTSQFISIFIFAAGCLAFAVMQHKAKANPLPQEN